MKNETATWLGYAEENLAVALLALEQGYFNACLQNIQQCMEKSLKAVVIENGLEFRKTHSIQELAGQLTEAGLEPRITEDECDLIDSIYLPSKYPMSSILPEVEAGTGMCKQCLDVAKRVVRGAKSSLSSSGS